MEVGRKEGRVRKEGGMKDSSTSEWKCMCAGFAVSPSPHLLNDADFKSSVAYHIDAVVHLPRSKQDGP